MARYAFSLGTDDELRETGYVFGDSFDEALRTVSQRYRPTKGDTLEIGVDGFPPARYQHTGFARGVAGWRPAGLMAA